MPVWLQLETLCGDAVASACEVIRRGIVVPRYADTVGVVVLLFACMICGVHFHIFGVIQHLYFEVYHFDLFV